MGFNHLHLYYDIYTRLLIEYSVLAEELENYWWDDHWNCNAYPNTYAKQGEILHESP